RSLDAPRGAGLLLVLLLRGVERVEAREVFLRDGDVVVVAILEHPGSITAAALRLVAGEAGEHAALADVTAKGALRPATEDVDLFVRLALGGLLLVERDDVGDDDLGVLALEPLDGHLAKRGNQEELADVLVALKLEPIAARRGCVAGPREFIVGGGALGLLLALVLGLALVLSH